MSLNTFDRAKLAQKFQPSSQRPACLVCANRSAEPVSRSQRECRFQCLKGGFFVDSYSVCAAYQARAETGAAA